KILNIHLSFTEDEQLQHDNDTLSHWSFGSRKRYAMRHLHEHRENIRGINTEEELNKYFDKLAEEMGLF
ncbi:hypothetical protein Bhyg_05052, partial [Pseudolycoriella hygida]